MAPSMISSTAANLFYSTYLVGCVVAASLGFFIIGFDQVSMRLQIVYFDQKFKIAENNSYLTSMITNLFVMVGSIVSGMLSNSKGRKCAIFSGGVLYLVGISVMYFTTSYAIMMVSRAIVGVAFGIFYTIIPVYIAELSPYPIRGRLSCFSELFYNIGSLLPFIYFLTMEKLSEDLAWKIHITTSVISALLMISLIWCIPESPWWLMAQGKIKDTAAILYRCETDMARANCRLHLMKLLLKIPLDDNGDHLAQTLMYFNVVKKVDFKKLFHGKAARKILISVIGLNFIQQASGIETMVSRFFLDNQLIRGTRIYIGLSYIIVVLLIKTIALTLPMCLLDKCGRRPLLLTSIGMMAIFLGFYGLSNLVYLDKHSHHSILQSIVSAMAVVYVAFYSIGLGPITWIYSSEVFQSGIRVEGMICAIIANRLTLVIVCSYINSAMMSILPYGGVILVLYFFIADVGFVFCFEIIKETCKKSSKDYVIDNY